MAAGFRPAADPIDLKTQSTILFLSDCPYYQSMTSNIEYIEFQKTAAQLIAAIEKLAGKPYGLMRYMY